MSSPTEKTDVVILIPAAGASKRMRGRDKLLESVAGEALLARQARIALATGACVLVTLPPEDAERRAALANAAGSALALRNVSQASEGLAASIREGADWAQSQGAPGLMILLADMPDLDTADLVRLMDAFGTDPTRIWQATDQSGQPGHPVILPKRLFVALAQLTGDNGARNILAQEPVAHIALPGAHATTDLDTPEAWAVWRGRTGK